jgi:hypothetical protein
MFWVKILKFFDADWGWKKFGFGSRDPGWKKFVSNLSSISSLFITIWQVSVQAVCIAYLQSLVPLYQNN